MKNQNKILLSFSVAMLMGATGAFANDPVVAPTIASQAYVDAGVDALKDYVDEELDAVDTALATKVTWNNTDIATSIRTKTEASDEKIPTEKAVATVIDGLTGGGGTVAQQIADALQNYTTTSDLETELAAKANAATTYTKTETDALLAAKQGTLTAGSNITIENGTISATDTTYATGTAETAGLTKLYTATGENTDGTMTQNAITTALGGKQASLPSAETCRASYANCILLSNASGQYEWVGVALAPAQ